MSSSSSSSEFDTFAVWPTLLSPRHVEVDCSPAFNRVPCPSLDGPCIDDLWAQLCEQNASKTFFNGTKFRLHEAAVTCSSASPSATASSSSSTKVKLQLKFGITDYRSSTGTTRHASQYRGAAGAVEGAGKGILLHGSSSGATRHLAQALGVESLVVTSDGYAALFRRSNAVADMPGWYCCPGGHPEPSNLVKESTFSPVPQKKEGNNGKDGGEGRLDTLADWFSHCASSCVVRELFDAAVEEVVAELGVAPQSLVNHGLLALMTNRATSKPDLLFVISVSMSALELRKEVERSTAAEAYERADEPLRFVNLNGGEAESETRKSNENVVEDSPLYLLDVTATEVPITPPSMACLVLGRQWWQESGRRRVVAS